MSRSPSPASDDASRGVRTQVLLVCAMTLVTVLITVLFLFLVRRSLRAQVSDDLAADLAHSVVTFRNLQAERFAALERENSLLSTLPTLKALMTSGDDLTIQDGAVQYSQLSGNDLFALTAPDGRVVAVYTRNQHEGSGLRAALANLVANPNRHNLMDGNALYACSVQPMYFGANATGTLLGYVISGVSIERTVRQISTPSSVEAAFLSNGRVLASTFPPAVQTELTSRQNFLNAHPGNPLTLTLGATRYLAATEDLTDKSTAPLQLLVFKSLAPADLWIARINHIVLSAGVILLIAGTLFMLALARFLTSPLEELSRSVRAFGLGDLGHRVPRYGTREVRQLSAAFDAMCEEIQVANQARLESERLATIGLMASSVSHDLRHYLAAVYGNAEFLASDTLSQAERAEIFADIRSAVLGTADMIESLLIFSRTGSSLRRSAENITAIVDHTIAVLRSHPDAQRVVFRTDFTNVGACLAFVDGKRLERAFYNLLLNACQAGAPAGVTPSVALTMTRSQDTLVIDVEDNGSGVPDAIRTRLFEPFVSQGKQKGTGLGLTLACCIAEEHGGEVVLLESRPGKTVFRMRIILVDPPPGTRDEEPAMGANHETVPN